MKDHRKKQKALQMYIDNIVETRLDQGRRLQVDVLLSEYHSGYTLRFYEFSKQAILKVDVSLTCCESGKVFEVITKAFDIYPFNKPSPLEKALK